MRNENYRSTIAVDETTIKKIRIISAFYGVSYGAIIDKLIKPEYAKIIKKITKE